MKKKKKRKSSGEWQCTSCHFLYAHASEFWTFANQWARGPFFSFNWRPGALFEGAKRSEEKGLLGRLLLPGKAAFFRHFFFWSLYVCEASKQAMHCYSTRVEYLHCRAAPVQQPPQLTFFFLFIPLPCFLCILYPFFFFNSWPHSLPHINKKCTPFSALQRLTCEVQPIRKHSTCSIGTAFFFPPLPAPSDYILHCL